MFHVWGVYYLFLINDIRQCILIVGFLLIIDYITIKDLSSHPSNWRSVYWRSVNTSRRVNSCVHMIKQSVWCNLIFSQTCQRLDKFQQRPSHMRALGKTNPNCVNTAEIKICACHASCFSDVNMTKLLWAGIRESINMIIH